VTVAQFKIEASAAVRAAKAELRRFQAAERAKAIEEARAHQVEWERELGPSSARPSRGSAIRGEKMLRPSAASISSDRHSDTTLIRLREAVVLSGRSEDELLSYVKAGRIKVVDNPRPGSRRLQSFGPFRLKRGDVLAVAQ